MYINKNKILQSKVPQQSEIEKEFSSLKENDTMVNRLHFMENFRNQSNLVILENLKYLYGIPSLGTNFLNHFVKTSGIGSEILEIQKENLVSFINKLESNNYVNYAHMDELHESVSIIESLIQERNSTDYLKRDTIVRLNIGNIRTQCTVESYLADDLDVIVNNINYNPETIVEYEKLLRSIKLAKSPAISSSFPMLLNKNTNLIIGIKIPSIGTGISLIASLPEAIADKIIEFKIKPTQVNSYIKIIDQQIALIYQELKHGENSKYNMYMTCLNGLKNAKNVLTKYCNVVKENTILVSNIDTCDYENYIEEAFGYDTKTNEKINKAYKHNDRYKFAFLFKNFGDIMKNMLSSKDKSYKSIWPRLLNMVDSCKTIDDVNHLRRDASAGKAQLQALAKNKPERKEAIDEHITWLNTTYKDALNEKSKELRSSLKESMDIVFEGIAEMQPEIKLYEEGVIEDLAAELEDILVDIVFDDSDEIPEDTLESLTRIYLTFESLNVTNDLDIVDEAGAISNAVIKGAHKIGKTSQKAVSKIASAGSTAKRISTPINKIADPFINFVNKTLDNIKQMDAKERRNRIITGQFRFKLFNTLTKGIASIASGKLIVAGLSGGAIVSPLLTLIGTIAAIAIDKKLDRKQRQNLLQELQGELKIVNEKIEDSRGDENKEKKYQLMRIQQKLEKDIERIKYHLD